MVEKCGRPFLEAYAVHGVVDDEERGWLRRKTYPFSMRVWSVHGWQMWKSAPTCRGTGDRTSAHSP